MTSQNCGLLMEMRAGMAALVSNLARRSSFPEHTYIPNCSHSDPLNAQIPLAFPAISPANKKALCQLRGGPAPARPAFEGGQGAAGSGRQRPSHSEKQGVRMSWGAWDVQAEPLRNGGWSQFNRREWQPGKPQSRI